MPVCDHSTGKFSCGRLQSCMDLAAGPTIRSALRDPQKDVKNIKGTLSVADPGGLGGYKNIRRPPGVTGPVAISAIWCMMQTCLEHDTSILPSEVLFFVISRYRNHYTLTFYAHFCILCHFL